MAKIPKNTTAAAKKGPAKTSSSSKPPAKPASSSRGARAKSAASSAAEKDVAKQKVTKVTKKEAEKAKRLEENAKIRNKASELLLREVKEEEAKAKNCTKKRIRSASDDEENPGEVIAGDVTDDSDSQKSGSGTQSLAGGGIASDDESSSEGGHGLHFDDLVEMSDQDGPDHSNDDGACDGKVEDDDMVVEEEDMPSSRRKSRASSGRSSGRSMSSKVTREDFSPRSVRLAEAGRIGVRVTIATGDQGAFPHEHKELTWNIVQDLVTSPSAEAEWSEILEDAGNDLSRKVNLTAYSWTGASQMRGELKKKAAAILCAHYGLAGNTKAETKDLVEWLLEKGRFKYGGLNTKTRTFDREQPMCHPIFRDLIHQQWFSSRRAEGISQDTASAFKDIPLPLIVLVITVVENALLEYKQDGGRTQIKFSLDCVGPRYTHHMKCAQAIQKKSPKWFATFQKTMYRTILELTNFGHLLADVDEGEVEEELDELNFDALERTATKAVTPTTVET